MRRRPISFATVVAVVLAACGDDQASTSPTDETSMSETTAGETPTTASTTTSTTIPTSTTSVVATTMTAMATTTTEGTMTTSSTPDADPMVEQAMTDLAERLGSEPDEIEIVSVEEVTWRDGSLGCPAPGRVYTQALVAGGRIVLAVDGIEYEYHSGGSVAPFYCPPERVAPPSDAPDPGI